MYKFLKDFLQIHIQHHAWNFIRPSPRYFQSQKSFQQYHSEGKLRLWVTKWLSKHSGFKPTTIQKQNWRLLFLQQKLIDKLFWSSTTVDYRITLHHRLDWIKLWLKQQWNIHQIFGIGILFSSLELIKEKIPGNTGTFNY